MTKIVIITDMLRGFHDLGNLANPRTALVIPPIESLLTRKVYQEKGWVTVFLRDYHEPDDKEFKMFPPHCVKGTKETNIVDELIEFCNVSGFICNKTRYSGFYNTGLGGYLKRESPDQIVVVGVCSDICVLHTVADLRNRDYQVVVPKDCVETYDAPGHNAEECNKWALEHMKSILGATIVDSQEEI